MADQTAKLDWRDGVPIARAFDDPYFSLDDGLAETTHVFLGGNDLPARFTPGFHVAELGFGTGLNFLVTWQAWIDAGRPGPLLFTSFEAFPMAGQDMQSALSHFPTLAPLAAKLLAEWTPDSGAIALPDGPVLQVIIGDARDTVPAWGSKADAWYLDGFSPAKNPKLWESDLLYEVGKHTKPGGTAATYSAAGHVRQSLSDAGFTVERTKGYGRKRHMTRAWMPDAE
ncbi:tRNA (5-methylaminomethyl-2-thiouridine)(34)-methyltransferase MnmD [Yoonia sediminilitoris]|uniref:tRNA U34 5-methylaminomethyl-2-thiouridine-forming methyltransferase MnmC n=1 Tax=Yoonia sediminilitoris TaxID=1286148 RepID=A0A2T6KG56_9RHOB|nr:tRNA (5-methylaminomethyl-2-thiouridine)(34)-methyltransferase MnmD [Yoonia sediminilitoris]PUB14260.1 tRNA U34 5-methylaminomethyl-2-thiouridine-forming methyltransferase MnmC [Yoonia sediminilitoris]RCW95191.1 tRNA U34 5-methylaminomethyl-2-thiouridine-forming methyltransferase MnmC [Yoonia sediminilitoris]